jgi:hypothetical protein
MAKPRAGKGYFQIPMLQIRFLEWLSKYATAADISKDLPEGFVLEYRYWAVKSGYEGDTDRPLFPGPTYQPPYCHGHRHDGTA